MKTAIHPAVFLCCAVAFSGAWLWLRPAPTPVLPAARACVARAQPPPRPSVQVDPAKLARYAGKYAIEGLVIEIRVADGRLVGDAGQTGRVELVARSDTRFAFESIPGEITFDDDGDRPSQRFVADLANGRLIAKRLPE